MRTHLVSKASGLKKLAKNVGQNKYSAIAKTVVKMKTLRHHVIQALLVEIQKELTVMTSKKTQSVLRDKARDAYSKFSWDSIIGELQKHAPTLLKFLSGCVNVKRRRMKKVKRANKNRPKINSIIALCASILLRNKSSHMNLLQQIMSVILQAGHASKQVQPICTLFLILLNFLHCI